jgi:hypothetical protein
MIGVGIGILQKRKTLGTAFKWVIPISGNPLAPETPTNGTIVFSATQDLTVEATGDAVIVSTTRAADDTFRRHTVVVSCVNGGSGSIVVKQSNKVVSLGNHRGALEPTVNFYTGTNATAPRLSWNLNDTPVNCQKIRQSTAYANILPTTGNRALPTGLTFLQLSGNNINWTYNGALPTGLTYLLLIGTNINWTYNGAMPTGLTFLQLIGTNINWTYNGALPTGLTYLHLEGANINWTGALLGRVTGTPKPNMLLVLFLNYRNPSDTMDYTDLLSLLDSLINNVGTLPTTVIIREQIADNVTAIAAAEPVIDGTQAEQCKYFINLIKSTKGVTTFTLNTTNI